MANGYHTVSTLMQTISLYDEITITLFEGTGIRIECEGDGSIPTDSGNLAYQAAAKFLTRAGISSGLTVSLKKRIPVAAGLAGGSADAAAVLRACNRMFDNPFTKKDLLQFASELGSDVPFCLVGGLAQCEGRGEILTELSSPEPFSVLIVNGGEKVSTAEAYHALDTAQRSFHSVFWGDIYRALQARNFPVMESLMQNDFSRVVLPCCPHASRALEELRALGAFARMSGSGSAVFGVFSDEAAARDAMGRLSMPSIYADTL